jgi:hypothetical protein
MKTTSSGKTHVLAGCCGMSCSLCPRFHTAAKSKCLGCGPDPHCQFCSSFKCCTGKSFETCADCPESPCDRIKGLSDWKGFPTEKIWLRHVEEIKDVGLEAWEGEQLQKKEFLEAALAEHDSGRSKRMICLSFLTMSVAEIDDLLRTAGGRIKSPDVKVRASEFRALLKARIEEARA